MCYEQYITTDVVNINIMKGSILTMKKLLGVLVAVAMVRCLCVPVFAADDAANSDALSGLSDALGGLDLSGLDVGSLTDGLDLSGLTDGLTGLTDGLDLSSLTDGADLSGLTDGLSGLTDGADLSGITDSLSGLTGGESGSGLDSILSGLTEFDPSGALSSFTEGLDTSSFSDLFSGLLGSLGSEGIDLSTFEFGEFDVSSLLGGGEGGSSIGVDSIMDTFGGVLETLGMDDATIDKLLNNDIVNFFANLYLGASQPVDTTAPTEPAPETTTATYTTPDTGVDDASAVIVACATLSVAAAAAFVCTRKKHA